MKVAVLNADLPFVRGGAEVLADGLIDALQQRGHQTELIRIPFTSETAESVLDALLVARLTRIPGADRVIALKYPFYCVDHPGMVVWLVHQHRRFYDLWGRPEGAIQDTAENRAIRDTVKRAERNYLRKVPRFAISSVVSDRLRHNTGLGAAVLHPPLPPGRGLTHPRHISPPGDYLFLPGRTSWLKRQRLAIQALRHVRSDVRLVIAGPVSEPGTAVALKALVAAARLKDRVTYIDRWVSDDEQRSLYAGALAVVVPAYDEEYGLVVIEAFAAGRGVVTCTDSGSPATLVQHGESGLITGPDSRPLADAFDRLRTDRDLAVHLGAGARERFEQLDLSWDRVVHSLLS